MFSKGVVRLGAILYKVSFLLIVAGYTWEARLGFLDFHEEWRSCRPGRALKHAGRLFDQSYESDQVVDFDGVGARDHL